MALRNIGCGLRLGGAIRRDLDPAPRTPRPIRPGSVAPVGTTLEPLRFVINPPFHLYVEPPTCLVCLSSNQPYTLALKLGACSCDHPTFLTLNHEPDQYLNIEANPTPSTPRPKLQVSIPRPALLARFDREAWRLWVRSLCNPFVGRAIALQRFR